MIVVPPAFEAMPRWWGDGAGRAWLEGLPSAVEAQCRRWGLEVDGVPQHGSNALVVPVSREQEPFALRLTPPGDELAAEVRALRVWGGRGTVELVDADERAGATLLERLDHTRSLSGVPLVDAVEVLAALTRVLAVPVPEDVPATATLAARHRDGFESDWLRLGRPTPASVLAGATADAAVLAAAPSSLAAVDGDLHCEQVLAGRRAPWLVVDPVLLRGDPEYDLGRILWSRLDEVPDDGAVAALLERFVGVAGVPADRAVRWIRVRAMSYLLWGLDRGLTLDPPRCLRLLRIFG